MSDPVDRTIEIGSTDTEELIPVNEGGELLNPEEWELDATLSSVSIALSPLIRLRSKVDPTQFRTEEVKLPNGESVVEVLRLCMPIGLAPVLAMEAAGRIYAFFIPKSITLAKSYAEKMNFNKDHLIFGAELNEEGNCIPTVTQIASEKVASDSKLSVN